MPRPPRRKMPVLVAYNLPFRDCAQYSAGGAANTAEYKAWIDGVRRRASATAPATVILEPDGLGIIPYYTDLDGEHRVVSARRAADPATAAAERFAQLNHAVDALKAAAGDVRSTSTAPTAAGSASATSPTG